MSGVPEKPSWAQLKRLREMYREGKITVEELLERVRIGRFDNVQRKISEMFSGVTDEEG